MLTIPKEDLAEGFWEREKIACVYAVLSEEWGFLSCRMRSMPWNLTRLWAPIALSPLVGEPPSRGGVAAGGPGSLEQLGLEAAIRGSSKDCWLALCYCISWVVFLLGTRMQQSSAWGGGKWGRYLETIEAPSTRSSSSYLTWLSVFLVIRLQ